MSQDGRWRVSSQENLRLRMCLRSNYHSKPCTHGAYKFIDLLDNWFQGGRGAARHWPQLAPYAVYRAAGCFPFAGLRTSGHVLGERGGVGAGWWSAVESWSAGVMQARGGGGRRAQELASTIRVVEHAKGHARARVAGRVVAAWLACHSEWGAGQQLGQDRNSGRR